MFGAVVVGVGTAGRVRIRDMLAPLPGSPAEKLSVRGFISRRSVDTQQGVSQISLEEAKSRADIHAAFICTENASHEDYIRKCDLGRRKRRAAKAKLNRELQKLHVEVKQ